MAVGNAQMEAIKAALYSGTASGSTARSLESLLTTEVIAPEATKTITTKAKLTTSKTASVSNAQPRIARSRAAPPVAIQEDPPKCLSGREKYALATDTVNACLKVLTDSLKSGAKIEKRTSPARDNAPSTPPNLSKKPLQPRSGNVTPVRSPLKRSNGIKAASPTTAGGSATATACMVAVAECARLGFAFLQAVDTKAIGVRDMPPLQLETGRLALVGRLIGHGLVEHAAKELKVIKRRLEELFGFQKGPKPLKCSRAPSACSSEKAVLASLLTLGLNSELRVEALPLAITYHQHVLKLIALSMDPAEIEGLADRLSLEAPSGPVNLITQQVKQSGDTAKAAKQLEALSQTLLSLCPSVASSADEVAADGARSPSPPAAFELQILALRIRKLWWSLARHQADVTKELLEPYGKCLSAFVRRHTQARKRAEILDLLGGSLESLGPFNSGTTGQALFGIFNVLCSEAERAGQYERALHWAGEMVHNCSTLDPHHSKRVGAIVKRTSIALLASSCEQEAADEELKSISDLLDQNLTGNSADYERLLSGLASLIRLVFDRGVHSSQSHRIIILAASFAQRYARSYPGHSLHQLQIVTNAALKSSKSTDDMLAWVAEDAARIFMSAGALKAVAEVAATRPMSEAWSSSGAVVSLGRVVRALTLRVVRSDGHINEHLVFDEEKLSSPERGALLEWQLRYVTELALRPKYHDSLKSLVSDILRRLSKVYPAAEFPIRRTRVASIAFQLRECHPELLPPHAFKVWHDEFEVDPDSLSSDTGLAVYYADVVDRLAVARLFAHGSPKVKDLVPHLRLWRHVMDGCKTRKQVGDFFDDPASFAVQLRSIAAYFCMLGEDAANLATLRLLVQFYRVYDADSVTHCTSMIDLGSQCLHLGYSEKAGKLLAQIQRTVEEHHPSDLIGLQHRVVYAEHLLTIDNHEKCQTVLDECRTLRQDLPPEIISREQRRTYELLHAEGWLIQSRYLLKTGAPHDALTAAKRSVRVLNSIWSAVERSSGTPKPQPPADTAVDGGSGVNTLTAGVSKLQLTPEGDSHAEHNKKGAAFWPIVPVLCKALLHLSDMYAHHGLFNEANYYSERAVGIAGSVGSPRLLSRLRSHRSRLLTLAGRLEEAELCLAQNEADVSGEVSLAAVELLCAKAAIRAKEGSLEDALALDEQAKSIVEQLSSDRYIAGLEQFFAGDNCVLETRLEALSLADPPDEESHGELPKARKPRVAGRGASRQALQTSKPKATVPKTRIVTKAEPAAKVAIDPCYPLDKLKGSILVANALLQVQLGREVDAAVLERLKASPIASLETRQINYARYMGSAIAALEMDVTLNVLTESTLSFPAIIGPDSKPSFQSVVPSTTSLQAKPSAAVAKSTARTTKKRVVEQEGPEDCLLAARECMLAGHTASLRLTSTAQTHSDCSKLSSVSLLLSAISKTQVSKTSHPIREGLNIDLPRIKALQYERRTVEVDNTQPEDSEPLTWPRHCNGSSFETVTATEFQEKYVDIIPKSWTAVSLCLSEDCSELYIARYRSGQSPLIVKLPFTRHKPDEVEGEAFDYQKGKAELQEIIELSNYTCHNPGSLDAKGAKSKWWKEREALDRRMHELLINIENIWFGGFKAVFSLHTRHADLLARFRKSFDQVLDRYLPSRQALKGRTEKLALDDRVLELFVGLGSDQDGVIDLEEPLADLLYFVVDMLQFNGERNAYDEIDFDGMAVDVLDILRTYHETCGAQDTSSQHLILVLDRRLQAFPWESLPCLEDASVSRVGSMLSLRERIVTMQEPRRKLPASNLPNNGEGCHVVGRTSGAYILNPSSDLQATQTTLQPALSTLSKADDASWTSIVNREPTEEQFGSALRETSMVLYFGHGAGSQYIRPRSIKRLDQCSEVVWLMGCSSGAVFEHGELEPCAVPLTYLLAGGHDSANSADSAAGEGGKQASGKCMAVVSTLWDVTDKDIDRFSLAVGEEWGLWPASEQHRLPAKTPRKREVVAAPCTPEQIPKTPKTPKVRKTPAPTKTPARSRSRLRRGAETKRSLIEAVAKSRDVCYLRYLNGAAPVVYGVPVYLGDQGFAAFATPE
ncbi:separin protein [Vermiconidia calcicola]|uniref:Separin protein n=1 Tax=Vermiconidia calcicola TaxID=1690605 RepID=A0ACC3NMY5_9PEZI|nr:separin protein [Vermiconidia calcicola]